jgi:hypothetical protein
MSDRHKTHHGRDRSGHHKVKRVDVEDLQTNPNGRDYLCDDVKLGGAVEDIGTSAGLRGKHIGDLVKENRTDVDRVSEPEKPS